MPAPPEDTGRRRGGVRRKVPNLYACGKRIGAPRAGAIVKQQGGAARRSLKVTSLEPRMSGGAAYRTGQHTGAASFARLLGSGASPARSADVALGRAAWRSAVVLWEACSIRHPNARCAPAVPPTPAPVSGAGSERRCRSARRVGRAARKGRACCSPPRRSRLPPAGSAGTGCDRWRRWRSRIPGSPRSRAVKPLRAPGSAARAVSDDVGVEGARLLIG